MKDDRLKTYSLSLAFLAGGVAESVASNNEHDARQS